VLQYCIYTSQVIAKRFSFSRVPHVFLPLRVSFYLFTRIPHVTLPFVQKLSPRLSSSQHWSDQHTFTLRLQHQHDTLPIIYT